MEISEYQRCPNGHMMLDGEKYCVVCGSNYYIYTNPKKCPEASTYSCGRRTYTAGEKFCPHCGKDLVEVK